MSSDDQQNLPVIPEQAEVQHVTVTPVPVAEFEGEYVRHMFGKLPAISLPMEYGYPRGAHLKIELEVRVRSVIIDEMKGKNLGELSRMHTFSLEEAKIVGAYTAAEMDPGVGGSAAATGHDIEDEEEDENGIAHEVHGEGDSNDVGF